MAGLTRIVFAFDPSYFEFVLSDVKGWLASNPLGRVFLRHFGRNKILVAPYLFIHVPKNAGTSVSNALYDEYWGHQPAKFFALLYSKEYDPTKTFAILRDPVDRCVSSFFFVLNNGTKDVGFSRYWRRRTIHIKTLDDYIDFLEQNQSRLSGLDFVMRPQSDYVCDSSGKLIVDVLFLLGRDDEELSSFVMEITGTRLPRLNVSERTDIVLTATQRSRILALYAQDAILVGGM